MLTLHFKTNKKNFAPAVSPLAHTFPSGTHGGPTIIFQRAVNEALYKIQTNNATGSDNIPGILLKETAKMITVPLTNIFNCCVNTNTFPDVWKCANVIPIPKSSPAHIQKLRPISLLPIISKVFETLLLEKISFLFHQNISQNQFGFLPNSSTQIALIHLLDKITCLLDEKDTTAVSCLLYTSPSP